jgi:predicted nucleic acid-binding protein
MRVERFLDTNILLYGYDLDAPVKRAIAEVILSADSPPRQIRIA